MKIISTVLLTVASVTLYSCDHMTVSTGDGSVKVESDGKRSSESRTVDAFSAIRVEGVFNVFLQQGDKEAVKVEADENIVPVVVTKVDKDTLVVKLKDNVSVRDMDKVNVYITLTNIRHLETAGVGTLKCLSKLNLSQLKFDCEGVGSTELDLNVDQLNVQSEIVGGLTLSGKAKNVTINHSGVGTIDAFGLSSENLSLSTSGVGSAEVNASKTLSIDASGIGDVRYKGGAVTHIRADGVGKVKEVN